MNINGNNHSIQFPFVGGCLTVLSYLITQLHHLIEAPTTIMIYDIVKTILLGFLGAIASGIGSHAWNKLKKRFKP